VSLVSLLLCACGAGPLDGQDGARRLERARIALSDSPVPPPADHPGWEAVSLPDRWRERRRGTGGFAWYRLELPGPVAPGGEWALYLPHLDLNAAAWVNGAPVGSGGRFSEPVARNFNRPLYFAFPSDLLDRPVNEIHVRLFAQPHLFGELGAPWVGPGESLRAHYEAAFLQRVTLAQVATALCLTTMLFCAALWFGSRGDPVYGWLALVTALWAIASLNYWLRDVPVATWTWERSMHAALDLFMFALACWAHRYAGVRRPRLERAFAAAAAAAFAVVWLVPAERFYPTVNYVHAAVFPATLYGTLLILRHVLRAGAVEAAIYVPAGLAALGLAVHDLLLQFGATEPGAPFLLLYLVPLMLAAFGSTLVLRYAGALRSAETLNRELEWRVDEKHRELEDSYAARRALERDKLLAEERERLVREMHDGMGGQLVSLLSLAEADERADPRLVGGLRAALDDMRLVIHSLDPALQTLGGALGAARARFEPALAQSGIALEWQAGDLPPTPWLQPQDYLQVLRIVQEALVNAVRHAGARRVAVRSGTRAGEDGRAGIRIEVCDDGRGIDAATLARAGGRGVRHMRERAARLSGSLSFEPGDSGSGPGTRVVLWLPAQAPLETHARADAAQRV
jgi:signal transduction histidine kinase